MAEQQAKKTPKARKKSDRIIHPDDSQKVIGMCLHRIKRLNPPHRKLVIAYLASWVDVAAVQKQLPLGTGTDDL